MINLLEFGKSIIDYNFLIKMKYITKVKNLVNI